jgi:hypothetical protein
LIGFGDSILLLTKPYTSVFFHLEYGYWNAEVELRRAMPPV